MKLRVRLREAESMEAKRTATMNASHQTTPTGPPSYEEPSNDKVGAKPKDSTAQSALKS